MSNNISFTIPLEASMLRHTITMLESALADIEDAPVLRGVVETTQEVFSEKQIVVEAELDPKVIFGSQPDLSAIPSSEPAPIALVSDALDDAGQEWDERIHVSTRTRRKSDNTWTLKRNVDPALVAQVRGITPPPTQAPEITPPPTQEPSVVDAFTDALSKVTTWLTSPQGAGFKVKMDMLLNSKGLASFAGLMTKQELIPEVMPLLEAEWNTLR